MRLAACLCLLASPALAQEASLAGAPAGWLGPTPHLVLLGTIDGHAIDVRLPDLAAAEGVAAFGGKREYLPGGGADGAGWRYGDFEVALQAVVGGVERSIELELENADFRAHPPPATFALSGENFPDGVRAFLEASAEWETEAETVNAELGGWEGTLTLAEDSGASDAEGLKADGLIGGHLDATRGADRLVASFTVPVTAVEKDD